MVESLYVISDPGDERDFMEVSLVIVLAFVLFLVFVLILVFVPLPSTNVLASNVFIITVEREEKKKETISTLKVEDVDYRGAIGSELPSVPNARTMGFPICPLYPTDPFKWQKSVWVSVVVHC